MYFLPLFNQMQGYILIYFLPVYLLPACNQVHIVYSWDNQTCLQKLKRSGLLSYMTFYFTWETAFQYFICPWVKGFTVLRPFVYFLSFQFYYILYSNLNLKQSTRHHKVFLIFWSIPLWKAMINNPSCELKIIKCQVVEAHTFIPILWRQKQINTWVQGQPGIQKWVPGQTEIHTETLLQKTERKEKKEKERKEKL